MSLPDDLSKVLEQLTNSCPKGVLTRAAADLTCRYRSEHRDRIGTFMSTDAHRLAYLSFRMPATYAVVKRVLNELALRMPQFQPASLCDLGAGPGTASWAAVNVFPSLNKVRLIEKDADWKLFGQKMMDAAGVPALKQAVWEAGDISGGGDAAGADLSLLSYVIGELAPDVLGVLVDRVWESTGSVAAFIEPGTPHGFERIRFVRDRLIRLGAHLVAPCPHEKACPMQNGNWCHFSERLERSPLHREVKGVEMGYEDEKYSYVIASKSLVVLPEARILRHPGRHSGHIDFEVCARNGLEKRTLSKRHKELYKEARKLDWGDSFSDP